MISKLSKKQAELFEQVNKSWRTRVYNYNNDDYENDCLRFITRFAEAAEVKNPVVVFLESPLACLLASISITKINTKELWNTFSIRCAINETWEEIALMNQCFNVSDLYSSPREHMRETIIGLLKKCKWNKDFDKNNFNGGDIVHNFFLSRNVEEIKKKISHYVWELYFPQGYAYGGDFMTTSLNLINDCYGNSSPWNYDVFIFYDFMSRLGIIQDPLFNSIQSLLLNGVYDFFWKGQFCFVSKLPKTVLRNKNGRLHSFEGSPAVEFSDGYKLYYKKGKRITMGQSFSM